MNARSRLSVIYLASWFLASLVSAADQQAKTAPPVFPAGLEAVSLSVTVRDPQGRFVSDLQPQDFVVREDGRPRDLHVFARASDGQDPRLALDLALLMDLSGSMIEDVKLSREAAVAFLDALPRAREVSVVFFDHEVQILRYGEGNRQAILTWIERASPGGGTALYSAIAATLDRMAGRPGRRVLVLLSDGEDYRSRISLKEVLDRIRSAGATVYPIAFSGGFPPGSTQALRAHSVLEKIADVSGGRVLTPKHSSDLRGIYQTLLDELSSQYVLGFLTDTGLGEARFRKLKVEVKRPGLKVRHRAGYYPPPDAER